MSQIKPTFTAADGESFDTVEQAEHHNLFIEARDAFETAWRKLKKVAIKGYKTADGYDRRKRPAGAVKTAQRYQSH